MSVPEKIKAGYNFVIEDDSVSNDCAPAHVYNVPNPPSDADIQVTKEQVQQAISVHRQTLTDQVNKLNLKVKAKR